MALKDANVMKIDGQPIDKDLNQLKFELSDSQMQTYQIFTSWHHWNILSWLKSKLVDIPDEDVNEYNLHEKVTPDGWIYMKIVRGMYGLPQTGSLGHDLLETWPNKQGYFQGKIVPELWKHPNIPIKFTLVVHDFGIKCVKREHLDHLIDTLKKYYDVSDNEDRKEYIKMQLDWNYKYGVVHLMPTYIERALHTYVWSKDTICKVQQIPPAWKENQMYIQIVNGKILCYVRLVDSTILTALSILKTQQSKSTPETMNQVKQVLDYCTSQEPSMQT